MDAVSYLSSALEVYRGLDLQGQKQLLAEAAAVGQKGLAINDPQQMHQLRLYQGGATLSALQVACVYYVGVQLLLPGQDAGIDFAREYELAKGMAGGVRRLSAAGCMQVLHCHRLFLVSPPRGLAPAAAQLVLAVVSAIGGVAGQAGDHSTAA